MAMGFGGVSIWQLLIVLLIVIMIFGTKRLKSLGTDLGGAVKSFRKAMDQDEDKRAAEEVKRIEAAEAAAPDAEFAEQKDKTSHG
jgi:sec-independent protein translocase protein TatA